MEKKKKKNSLDQDGHISSPEKVSESESILKGEIELDVGCQKRDNSSVTTSFALHYRLERLDFHFPNSRRQGEEQFGVEWKYVLQF